MNLELNASQKSDALQSLQRYSRERLDLELNEMQAGHLLDFVLREFGPFAYNQGVSDATGFLRDRLEDLGGTCFEEPLTEWLSKAPGQVRRKPD